MTSAPILLFGGTSSERKVSVASAQNVVAHWPESTPLFWAPTGGLYFVEPWVLQLHQRPFEVELPVSGAPAFNDLETAMRDSRLAARGVLLALHGGDGENGQVQSVCAKAHVAFTGSDAAASALSFDKSKSKASVAGQGIAVPQGMRLEPQSREATHGRLLALFDRAPRWVLKPESDGSSVGLFHLTHPQDVAAAVETLCSLGVVYLAEQFVEGRELTVGVIDSETGLRALPVSEVCLKPGATFDFTGKYLGHTEEKTPADLSEAQALAVQQLALTAHQTLGCYGYSRTDVILSSAGPVFLETNTLPGLTKASFIPQQLAAAGLSFRSFLERQMTLARSRFLTRAL